MTKSKKPSKIMAGMKFYIVEDLSKILSLNKMVIRDYLRKKKIKATKIGRRWYVSDANLKAFLGGGRFFDQPDDLIMDQINQAIKLTFEANVKWLAFEVKKLIIKDFTEIITERFKKIDEINAELEKRLPKKIAEHFRDRTDKAKKEFEEAKSLKV